MITVTFIDAQGARHPVRVPSGTTLMEAATLNEVPGIVGFCGGMCACGTCHCYLDDPWQATVPAPADPELDTLRRVLERRPESRLGCQLALGPQHDGIEVRLPARQRTP